LNERNVSADNFFALIDPSWPVKYVGFVFPLNHKMKKNVEIEKWCSITSSIVLGTYKFKQRL
jgi:hypothetical protein